MLSWTYDELVRKFHGRVTFDEDVEIDRSNFEGMTLINDVKDLHAEGSGYLDEEKDIFYVQIHLTGVMLVPDAVTAEEIEYPFETDGSETYSFDEIEEDEDFPVRIVMNDVIELESAIADMVLLEVPLQVTYASVEDYPQGDGWRVITEEEYQKSQEQALDPRLAKLMEFKADDK